MGSKTKVNWYQQMMDKQERMAMDKQLENENPVKEKKTKKGTKESPQSGMGSAVVTENLDVKSIVKITFEGEAAQRILRCEAELKERLSKPDMGKILGNEILTWTDKRWAELVEENTDIDYFFAQIRKCPDKSKSIKLLKALSEKLKNESPDSTAGTSPGLAVSAAEENQANAV